jgi:molecular chaperone DnaJ
LKDDKNSEAKFREATEAYEVLSDDKQREIYNQFGHAGVDPNFQHSQGNPFGGGGASGFEGAFNFGDGSFHFQSSSSGGNPEINPEELFDMFFGSGGGRGGSRRRGPRRGSDLQMHVRVSFQEAVFGATKDLHLRYQTMDRASGEIQIKERDVSVDIPAGIDNGMNLRLQGQGAEGDPGAQAGNLLVQVMVDEDDYFVRDGYDVHTEAPITLVQAVLGGSIDVRTLNGEVEMKVPKGCQPDTKLMLRGKGIQHLRGSSRGNQIVHLKLQIPKEITARQEELLRQFDQVEEEDDAIDSGVGISGRIGKVAESAFERMFGGNKNGGETSRQKRSNNNSKKSKKNEESNNKSKDEKKNQDAKNTEEGESDDDDQNENVKKNVAQ